MTEDVLGRPLPQNVVESCKCFSNNERTVRVRPTFFTQRIYDAICSRYILRAEARGDDSIMALADWFASHAALHKARFGTHADDAVSVTPAPAGNALRVRNLRANSCLHGGFGA
jgi:hypothetical protein